MSNSNGVILGAAFGAFAAVGLVAFLIGALVGGWNYHWNQKKQPAEDVEAQQSISLENRLQDQPPSRLDPADFDAFDFATSKTNSPVGPQPTVPAPTHPRPGSEFEEVDLS